MKKFDNLVSCFKVLLKGDRQKAQEDELHRMGILAQFNMTFELAWKTLQATLREICPVDDIGGSPRSILKLAFEQGLIKNNSVWRDILKYRNEAIHIYNFEIAEKYLDLIFDVFIPAMAELIGKLDGVVKEIENRETGKQDKA